MAFIVISLSHLLGCRFLFVWNGRSVPESAVVRLSNKEWVLEYWYECSVFLLLLLLRLSFSSLLFIYFFFVCCHFLQHLRDNFLFSILAKKSCGLNILIFFSSPGHLHTTTLQRTLSGYRLTKRILERPTFQDKVLTPLHHCGKTIHTQKPWPMRLITRTG